MSRWGLVGLVLCLAGSSACQAPPDAAAPVEPPAPSTPSTPVEPPAPAEPSTPSEPPAPETRLTVPSAPLEASATAGTASVLVAWRAPQEDGGTPLLGYVVESQPGGQRLRVGPDAREVTFTDLPSTEALRFTVSALNAVGEGPRTASTPPVRPWPGPVEVTRLSLPSSPEGCLSVEYTLRQPDGLVTDVQIDVDPGTGHFQGATQAASTTHEGLLARASSRAGAVHRFLWNRALDVPHAARARMRVSLRAEGRVVSAATFPVSLPEPLTRCESRLDTHSLLVLGASPYASAVSDFDRDGKLDVAVALDGGTSVQVFKGLGHGGFLGEPLAVLERGSLFKPALVAADLDGDGLVELLSSAADGRVGVNRNRGDGSFEATRFHDVVSGSANTRQAQGLAAADFNGDGLADVAVVGADGALFLLNNLGGGALGPARRLEVAYQAPGTTLSVADFDEDGRADLVAVDHPHGTYSLLRSRGEGSFELLTDWQSRQVGGVLLADFNGDGHLDLVLAQDTNAGIQLSLRRGLGRGLFDGPRPVGALPGGDNYLTHWAPLTAADLDGDGRLDLAVGLSESSRLAVNWGRGDGTFEPAAQVIASGEVAALASADFDSDGAADLLTLEGGYSVHVRRGSLREVRVPRVLGEGLFAVDDLNLDGWTDVVSADIVAGMITVRVGSPEGFFAWPPVDAGGMVTRLVVARIDGDAIPDVLVALSGQRQLLLFLGQGNGGLRRAGSIDLGVEAPSIRVGDADGDGLQDLIVRGYYSPGDGNRITQQVRLLRGRGDGTFHPASVLLTSLDLAAMLEVGDVDGNGTLDVVAPQEYSAINAQVLLGRGDGTFQRGQELRCGPYFLLGSFRLADLDGDGVLDAVCGSEGSGSNGVQVVFLRGAGDGTFSPQASVFVRHYPWELLVVDFDGDGRVDVLSPDGYSVSVMRGLGGGRFAPPDSYWAGTYVNRLAALDVDHDGRLELLAGGSASEEAVLLRQR